MADFVPPRRPAALAAAPPDAPQIWEPCPFCWGQRRIFHQTRNGEGLVPLLCTACLGVGERPAVHRPVAGPGPRR